MALRARICCARSLFHLLSVSVSPSLFLSFCLSVSLVLLLFLANTDSRYVPVPEAGTSHYLSTSLTRSYVSLSLCPQPNVVVLAAGEHELVVRTEPHSEHAAAHTHICGSTEAEKDRETHRCMRLVWYTSLL